MTPRRHVKILRRRKYDDSIGVIRANRDRRILRIVFGRGGGISKSALFFQETVPAGTWIEVQIDPSGQIASGFRKFVFTPALFLQRAQDKDIAVWDRYKAKFAEIVMMARLEG